jgi:quercetin dioxygenase-like cupin family protein
MKAKLLVPVLAVSLAAAAQASAAGVPITATALGLGKMQATTIHAQTGSMILDAIRIAPGGNFGWHVHGAPVAVVVTSGTLTVFDPQVAGCKPFKVSKGQSFVEPANHVHLARNDTAAPVTLYALYLGVPKPSAVNIGKAEPAGCDA